MKERYHLVPVGLDREELVRLESKCVWRQMRWRVSQAEGIACAKALW